jgi:hypothetical protein
MQDAINVEVGEGAGELVIFHNLFFKQPVSLYQKISKHIDLLHYIYKKELDNFTFLHCPGRGKE